MSSAADRRISLKEPQRPAQHGAWRVTPDIGNLGLNRKLARVCFRASAPESVGGIP
jgi:hypothetical protein